MGYLQDVKHIVGKNLFEHWVKLNAKVYYLNGEPYGLIAEERQHDIVYLYTCTNHADTPFSRGMLKYIRKLSLTEDICLVSGHKPAWGYLREALSRHGCVFKEHSDILWAYHFNIKD